MGVFIRADSNFFWIYLEGIRRKEATRIPVMKNGAPATQARARRAAQELYLTRMLEIAEELPAKHARGQKKT